MNEILIIIGLILLNGVFSMSEIALLSARKSNLNSDAKKGSKGAKEALKLAENSDNFLSTIQIGITLIGILTGLYSGARIADKVALLFNGWGISAETAHGLAQTLVVVIVTYLSIVVGELVPKRIGLVAANPVAKFIARPMRILSLIALPAVWILSKSTSLLTSLFGLKNNSNAVTEEEIKSLIQDCTDSGELQKIEQDIMERTLVLGDMRIASIMTPGVDVCAMDLGMNGAEVREQLSKELHSNYPVFSDKSQSEIVGMVSLKELILTLDNANFNLKSVMSDPVFFPETMRVYDALDRMKNERIQFSLVCDEFGALCGLLTPSDILDGLVGVLPEQAVPSDIIKGEGENTWIVNGQIPIYDFINFFELEELYRPSSYTTLGGLILEELKYIPREGETLKWNGIDLKVLSMDGAKINKIAVSIRPNNHSE